LDALREQHTNKAKALASSGAFCLVAASPISALDRSRTSRGGERQGWQARTRLGG
jgi:hypothetical protein